MAVPVSLGWLGIGREQIPGTPVLPSATVPVTMDAWEPEDTPVFLPDMGIRDVLATPAGMVMGPQSGTFSYGAPFYLDSAGWWLDNMFGDLSTVSNGTLATAQALAAPLVPGATSLTTVASLGTVNPGSVIQIGDGVASETLVATGSAGSGTVVYFTGTPCRFPHPATATAALQTAAVTYTHTFATLNAGTGQPATHTVTDTTGLTPAVGARWYPQTVLTALELSGDPAGFITAKYAGSSWLSAPAASKPTPATSFTAALAGWQAAVSIAGTPVTTIGPWAVTFSRDLVIYWGGQNSLTPLWMARGDLKAAGTLSYVRPADETPLTGMLSAGLQQVKVTASNGLAGASAMAVTVTSTTAQFTQAKPDRTRPYVRYPVSWGAVTNSTDTGGSGGTGPGTVVLTNAIAAY